MRLTPLSSRDTGRKIEYTGEMERDATIGIAVVTGADHSTADDAPLPGIPAFTESAVMCWSDGSLNFVRQTFDWVLQCCPNESLFHILLSLSDADLNAVY